MQDDLERALSALYHCAVPEDLGRITGFRHSHARVVADTESGIPMIVPLFTEESRKDAAAEQEGLKS